MRDDGTPLADAPEPANNPCHPTYGLVLGSNGIMIDSYSFGRMVIDGQQYTKDLIILPDGSILHPWWRKTGHALAMSDLPDVVATSPDVLVVGTGSPGLMKPKRDLSRQLEAMGIETRVMPTEEATREYNALREKGRNVAACFHLTC